MVHDEKGAVARWRGFPIPPAGWDTRPSQLCTVGQSPPPNTYRDRLALARLVGVTSLMTQKPSASPSLRLMCCACSSFCS